MSEPKKLSAPPQTTFSRSGNTVTIKTSTAGLKAVLDKAHAGDASSLPELNKILDLSGAVDILGGDLARDAQSYLIRKYAGKDLVTQKAVTRKISMMRSELSGPNPSPLERLLVERIVSTWLHLHSLEGTYHSREGMTLDMGEYYQRSIARAQKGYLSAIKTLATVRKLAVPALQVNIARKQVNVVGTVAEGSPAAKSEFRREC